MQWCVDRIKKATVVDDIIVATTTNPADIAIIEFCKKINCKTFMGSENDVLDRVYQAAKKHKADYIIEITADCPFIDPSHIDIITQQVRKNNLLYGCNIYPRTWPDGFDIQVYPFKTLKAINKIVERPTHRAHGGWNIINNWDKITKHFFFGNSSMFNLSCPLRPGIQKNKLRDYTRLECTLDTPADLKNLINIEKYLRKQSKIDSFTAFDIIEYLEKIDYKQTTKRKTPGDG